MATEQVKIEPVSQPDPNSNPFAAVQKNPDNTTTVLTKDSPEVVDLANKTGQNYETAAGQLLLNARQPILTSDTVVKNAENDLATLRDETKKMEQSLTQSIPTPQYQPYKDFSPDIQQARQENKSILDMRKENIEAEAKIRESEQRDANRMLTGQRTAGLARMGALNSAASAFDYVQQVEVQNQRELTRLFTQKQNLLIAAEQAYQVGDTKLLEALINENTRIVDQANKIQEWRMEDAIATNDQIMKQAKYGWEVEDRYRTDLTKMAELGTQETPENKAFIELQEKYAGVQPGTYQLMLNASNMAKKQAADKANSEYSKTVAEIMAKIPLGKTVSIGGVDYTGLDTDGMETKYIENNNGVVTQVVHNSATGETETRSLGSIGKKVAVKTDGDGNIYQQNPITGETELLMAKGGQFNTAGYLKNNGQDIQAWSAGLGLGTADQRDNGEIAYAITDQTSAITAPVSGKVVGFKVNNGYYVARIQDKNGVITEVNGLGNQGVSEGQTVKAGDPLGGVAGSKAAQIRVQTYMPDTPVQGKVVREDGIYQKVGTQYVKRGVKQIRETPMGKKTIYKVDDFGDEPGSYYTQMPLNFTDIIPGKTVETPNDWDLGGGAVPAVVPAEDVGLSQTE